MNIEPKYIVAAALHAAGEPVSVDRLKQALPRQYASAEAIAELVAMLEEEYANGPLMIAKVAGGYRVQIVPEYVATLQKMEEVKVPRYSRALLETLALIIYRQPITRGEIEAVRGVAVSTNIIKTLLERQWVRVVGHREVPGKPALYGSTQSLLDYFNLEKLSDLPPLDEVVNLVELESKLNEQLSLNVSGALSGSDRDEHFSLPAQDNLQLDGAEEVGRIGESSAQNTHSDQPTLQQATQPLSAQNISEQTEPVCDVSECDQGGGIAIDRKLTDNGDLGETIGGAECAPLLEEME